MTDKTTKALLLAIAIGLFADAAAQLARPQEAQAQPDVMALGAIQRDMHALATGSCANKKLCP